MAGSLRDFAYVDNFGEVWGLRADESNVEAVNAIVDYQDTSFGIYRLPQNLKPRMAVYQNTSGTRSLRVPVLTKERADVLPGTTGGVPAAFQDPLDDSNNAAILLVFNRFIPEKILDIPKPFDTGLNDGDELEV